jgi:NAD(P)-dependent dehydrogenase (short-subunit alcohol dehydrogenase family)
MKEQRLSGRVAIVGASSGIGRATAEVLAEAGFDVLAVGRNAEKLGQLEGGIRVHAADASDEQQMRRAYETFGVFEHLVLTPSSSRGIGTFAELDLNELRAGFDGKFWPFVVALQQAIPFLESSGSVTFVTAASSGGSMPGTAGLAAINAALEGMIPVLAVELAPRRVNAISPGVVDTPWWSAFPAHVREEVFANYARSTTLGRVADANDIADAIRFLIQNTYVTGNILRLDGGAVLARNQQQQR